MLDPSLPAGWPAQRPLAISVSVMLEGWSDDSATGIGPMGNPLKAGVLDLQARSWADYGPKVGAWRLLDLMAAAGVTAVFYVSGLLAERHPDLMRAITGAGHVVAAHGWTQNVIPATQSAEDEARDVKRCVQTLVDTTGIRPLGWISPRCTPSAQTTALLAGTGFTWHSDFFDTDLPYPVETPNGPVMAVPFTMEVNDMPLAIRYGNEPEAFTRTLGRLVGNWRAIGNRPGCLDITVHAHVFGRPAGAVEFKQSLELVQRRSDVAWLTNHQALAGLFSA